VLIVTQVTANASATATANASDARPKQISTIAWCNSYFWFIIVHVCICLFILNV